MPSFTFTSPEGKKYTVNGPEGATKEQAFEILQKQLSQNQNVETTNVETPQEESGIKQGLKNLAAGALSGAAQIGATALTPVDYAARKLGINNEMFFPRDRRAAIREGLQSAGADPESLAFQGGQLATEIAGTAGAGGALAKGLTFAPKLAAAVESGGFALGKASPGISGMATRAAGGALSGGAMAGMVKPEDTAAGMALGGIMPVAVKVAGKLGNALISKASPEVAALAQKAQQYGIDIPADRLVDSKVLNALSASLNYVPFSGRATTEGKLVSQINRAVSKTFGQDSENITSALRKASADLGSKFDDVLKNNTVKVDQSFLDDLVKHADTASKELEQGQARIIQNQIDEILAKANSGGEIDGQAAYNIKKTLDRIGKQNSPLAYYAKDLKMSLMDALNRSLGPKEAANFAKVRQQYGNMLTLEKLAPAGAEGEISMGRISNLRNVRDPQLRDIVDIAAQFGRTRENPHGAAQRVVLGALAPVAAATGQIPLYAASVLGGRAANTALNSQMVRNAMLRQQQPGGTLFNILANPATRAAIIQSNP